MKKYFRTLILLIGGLELSYVAVGQTPMDGLMMSKGQICIAPIYEYGTWDTYWEGTMPRDNDNIDIFRRNTFSTMVALGITDRINFIASVPFVKTDADGGQIAGVHGIQDLNLSVKAQFVKKEYSKSKLNFFANLSFSFPLSDYTSDYQPFSIGLGAKELGARVIGQYELDNGLYFRGSAAYLHRGTTEAERNFYYNDGAYYTTTMDVPNVFQSQLAIGKWFLAHRLRMEINYFDFKSKSGDDIRAFNSPQPTNKVEFDRVEGLAQYYFRNIKGFGMIAYYQQTLTGRNMGKFSTVGVGMTYEFQLFN